MTSTAKMWHLVRLENRGRSIVAAEEISAGTIVVEEAPFTFIVSKPFVPFVCAYCATTPSDGRIFAAGPQDDVRYCSAQCVQNGILASHIISSTYDLD